MNISIRLGLAFATLLAFPCLAGPIPEEFRGRWSDQNCSDAQAHILSLTSNQMDISQGGQSSAKAMVDAQARVTNGLRLRFTKIMVPTGNSGVHVGDTFVIIVQGEKLSFGERVINGKKVRASGETLSRCSP